MSKLTSAVLRAGVIAGLALSANQAYAACTFGGSGEPSLQATFNDLLGADTVDVEAGCIADGADTGWTTVGQAGFIDIHVELAGNATTNIFGIYDLVNNNQIRLFEGDDGAGVTGLIQLNQRTNGTWRIRMQDSHGSDITGDGTIDEGTGFGSWNTISSSAFGFFLATLSNGTFYSNTARNGDGQDHMYAYGPLGGDFQDQHILAWEDLFGGQDSDYQDFVATLVDITPVPLPTAVWLLGSGLIGLAGVARRRS